MPRGARHIETGTLRRGQWGYALHMDGGGIWELDVTRSPRKLLGQRVTIVGTRAGFNLLDVTRITLAMDSRHNLSLPTSWPRGITRRIHLTMQRWKGRQNG